MKLLKVDHYVITRELFEDIDGTLLELEIDSLGQHTEIRFDKEEAKEFEKPGSWQEYSSDQFMKTSYFGPKAGRLPGT